MTGPKPQDFCGSDVASGSLSPGGVRGKGRGPWAQEDTLACKNFKSAVLRGGGHGVGEPTTRGSGQEVHGKQKCSVYWGLLSGRGFAFGQTEILPS